VKRVGYFNPNPSIRSRPMWAIQINDKSKVV
jgi:hypothetical protein